ncbi:MAG: hypothetical protein KJ922_02675, partial [Nanoarchaeota archaeon]|nr:hypothetical protein [Nanoarchaeota archaeon]
KKRMVDNHIFRQGNRIQEKAKGILSSTKLNIFTKKIAAARQAINSDYVSSRQKYLEMIKSYAKLGSQEKAQIYPDLKKLGTELNVHKPKEKALTEKKQQSKAAQDTDASSEDINIMDILGIIKKRWAIILSGTIGLALMALLLTFFAVPKLYESSSMISLGIEDNDMHSIIGDKTLAESSLVLMPLLEEYFDDDMTLDKFKKTFVQVELVEEKRGVRETTIIPYLRITTKADEANQAKQMNEKIIENFFGLVKPDFEKEHELDLKKITVKEEEIARINHGILGIEELVGMVELLEARNETKDERVRVLKDAVFDSFEVSVEDLNITINMLDKALAEFSYRKQFSEGMIKILQFAERYLIEKSNLYNQLAWNLLSSVQRLSDMEMERVNIERNILEKEKEFTIISEPQLPLGNLLSFTTDSIIFLKKVPSGKIDDQMYFITESKNLIGTSPILDPVISEFFGKNSGVTLESFKAHNLNIELIQHSITTRDLIIIPYLRIVTRANSALRSKQINERVLENFIDYVSAEKNHELDLLRQKLDSKNEQILRLRSEIEGFENVLFNQSELRFVHIANMKGLLSGYNKAANEAEIEKANLEIEFNDQNYYGIVSEPQLPMGFSGSAGFGLNVLIAALIGFGLSVMLVVFYENNKDKFK